jgi:hypothetical protein
MWKQNLLFAGVCLAGLGALVAWILQSEQFSEPTGFSPQVYKSDDFQQTVDQINKEFHDVWQEAGLTPAPRASDLTIARRLSLGLTGAIPSLEEIRVMEQRPAQHRVQWWASHLLEDRRYADYMAERFARVFVGVEGGPFILYRRRRFTTWLSDQFYANRPYDQLATELIAGSGAWMTNPATNFITVTVDQNDKDKGPDEIKLAARVTRAFLGVRLDCVQCHDDELGEDWFQKDFHQLAAFFAPIEMAAGPHDNKDKEYFFTYHRRKKKVKVDPLVPFNRELMPKEGALRDRLAGWVTHKKNKSFARALVNRMWAIMFGRPMIEPIDEIPLKGPFPPGMETLAQDLVDHDYDLQRLIRVIAQTRVFQLDSRSTQKPLSMDHEKHRAAFPLTRLRPEQVVGGVTQASSLKTIDAESFIIVRLTRFGRENNFIKRYGDTGEDEFDDRGGTIPQRLLMMNGEIVGELLDGGPTNASTQITNFSSSDEMIVDTAYLTVLTRRPSLPEKEHFLARIREAKGDEKLTRVQDMYWALLNSTEFSWNH